MLLLGSIAAGPNYSICALVEQGLSARNNRKVQRQTAQKYVLLATRSYILGNKGVKSELCLFRQNPTASDGIGYPNAPPNANFVIV